MAEWSSEPPKYSKLIMFGIYIWDIQANTTLAKPPDSVIPLLLGLHDQLRTFCPEAENNYFINR